MLAPNIKFKSEKAEVYIIYNVSNMSFVAIIPSNNDVYFSAPPP